MAQHDIDTSKRAATWKRLLLGHKKLAGGVALGVVILITLVALRAGGAPDGASRADATPRAKTGSSDSVSPELLSQTEASAQTVQTTIAPTNDPLSEKVLAELYKSKDYCSKLEKACFTYPYPWTKKEIATGDADKEEVRLTGPNGTVIVWRYNTTDKLDGTCTAEEPVVRLASYNLVVRKQSGQVYLLSIGDSYPPAEEGIIVFGNEENTYLSMDAYGKKIWDERPCARLFIPTFKSQQDQTVLASLATSGSIHKDDRTVAEQILRSFRYQ